MSPEQAGEWLRHSPHRLTPHKLADYIQRMEAGTWDDTDVSHPVTFWNRIIKNGHHRLAAIVATRIPVNLWIDFAHS